MVKDSMKQYFKMLKFNINTFPVKQDDGARYNMSRVGKVNHGKYGKLLRSPGNEPAWSFNCLHP